MAFGGVEAGDLNPQQAPRQQPTAIGMGFTFAAIAEEIITGMISSAVAVVERTWVLFGTQEALGTRSHHFDC